jgi:hypothetical protein
VSERYRERFVTEQATLKLPYKLAGLNCGGRI